MAAHAGFGAVATASQQFVNQALRISWNEFASPVQIPLPPSVTVGTTTVSISGPLALAVPTVSLSANPNNTVLTDLVFAGAVVLQNGATTQNVGVALHAQLSIGLVTTVSSSGQIVAGLNLANANVDAVDVYVISGEALPSTFQNALNSQSVLDALTAALQAVPSSAVQFVTPLQSSYLIAPAYTPVMAKGQSYFAAQQTYFSITLAVGNIVIKPLNQALVIAVDFENLTNGDPNALIDLTQTDITGAYQRDNNPNDPTWTALGGIPDSSIAAIVNGSTLSGLITQMSSQASGQFPFDTSTQINSLGPLIFGYVTPPPDQSPPLFGASIGASISLWSATEHDANGVWHSAPGAVSFDLSFTAFFDSELSIDSADPNYGETWVVNDVGLEVSSSDLEKLEALVVVVVGMALPAAWVGLVALVNGIIPGFIASQVSAAILLLQQQLTPLTLTQGSSTGLIPGTEQPTWQTLTGMALSPDGPTVWVSWFEPTNQPFLTVNGQQLGAAPWPPGYPETIQADVETDVWSPNLIVATLSIPNGYYNPQDPTLRVTWTTLRNDTNQTLYGADLPVNAPGALTVSIDHASGALAAVEGFTITCKLYRALGYTTEMVVQYNVNVPIIDWVDRTHKFLRWDHQSWFRRPSWPKGIYWTRSRHSRIHRTDVPYRCLIMRWAPWPGYQAGPNWAPYEQGEYLDQLPFPSSELQQNRRGVLCDYCFFGGPTSTVPKIPPGQTLQGWLGS